MTELIAKGMPMSRDLRNSFNMVDHYADIHQMTGLLRWSFARIGNSGKAELW
jgi:hypothetical protein